MLDTVRKNPVGKGQNGTVVAQNGPLNPRLLVLQARRVFAVTLLYAALLSACINLLLLTMPLFMLQVYDRVLNSQSIDSLVMLTRPGGRRPDGLRRARVHPRPFVPGHGQRRDAMAEPAAPDGRGSGLRRPGGCPRNPVPAGPDGTARLPHLVGRQRPSRRRLVADLSGRPVSAASDIRHRRRDFGGAAAVLRCRYRPAHASAHERGKSGQRRISIENRCVTSSCGGDRGDGHAAGAGAAVARRTDAFAGSA